MCIASSYAKKVFLHLTVHTVHLDNFPFNIIKIGCYELVNSEHSTLHPCAHLRIEAKECRIRMWSEGGGKNFFLVLLFTLFTLLFYPLLSVT